MKKEQLTNEELKKHFKDSFELANFAIRTVRHLVRAGHEVNVEQLLRDIQKNPNLFTSEALLLEEKDEV